MDSFLWGIVTGCALVMMAGLMGWLLEKRKQRRARQVAQMDAMMRHAFPYHHVNCRCTLSARGQQKLHNAGIEYECPKRKM